MVVAIDSEVLFQGLRVSFYLTENISKVMIVFRDAFEIHRVRFEGQVRQACVKLGQGPIELKDFGAIEFAGLSEGGCIN